MEVPAVWVPMRCKLASNAGATVIARARGEDEAFLNSIGASREWSLAPRRPIRSKLVALGYEDMREAGIPGRYYFRRRATTAFNIALVIRDGPIWIANLALRDYLRATPDATREYAEVKRSAFDSGLRSLLAYSGYKNAVIARLLRQALDRT
jgi:GrpB-like predicted nucleotidyltransferase (UPF0157 family)